jgi:addiction module HigA family antidote
MNKRTQKLPANPFHPGEILLEEFLEPGGITQAAFATKVGWTKARLNELIKGKRGITADAALWASPEIPDTEIRCKDDLGGMGWVLEGCSLGSSSSRQ